MGRSPKKWRLRKIVRLETTPDFKLICTFDTKEIKVFDVKPLLEKGGPITEPLKAPSYFKKVFLEAGAPAWPNGFDICADLIYRKGTRFKSKPKAA